MSRPRGAADGTPLDAVLAGLHAADAAEVERAVAEAGRRLPGLGDADLRRAVEELCALFYVDHSDRPDLEPAVDRIEEALVGAGERVIPILMRLMEGSDIKSHFHLARTLGRFGPPALPHLRRAAALAEDPYSRAFAIYAIGKVKSPEVHEALAEVTGALMHPDKEVRDSAARTLGKIVEQVPGSALTERRRHEVYDALLRAVGDREPAVRAKAVRSLGKLARHGWLDASRTEHLRTLLAALLTRGEETDWDRAFIVRREAHEALAHLDATGGPI